MKPNIRKKSTKSFWKRGQQVDLARLSGVKASHLNDILHRRAGVGINRAIRLEDASKKMRLGIDLWTWLNNKATKHPAFNGNPVVSKNNA